MSAFGHNCGAKALARAKAQGFSKSKPSPEPKKANHLGRAWPGFFWPGLAGPLALGPAKHITKCNEVKGCSRLHGSLVEVALGATVSAMSTTVASPVDVEAAAAARARDITLAQYREAQGQARVFARMILASVWAGRGGGGWVARARKWGGRPWDYGDHGWKLEEGAGGLRRETVWRTRGVVMRTEEESSGWCLLNSAQIIQGSTVGGYGLLWLAMTLWHIYGISGQL
ncbi:hypothetical protein FIBSPDRAFT_901233 [Athelia psychrophila]|uniref:Uncharacterized protein n=1 Tax=Athelia psychrophila TaxID=1759441 RepID=A0A165XG31_9AGAM|nr:hypothetical protein FIBSPDRAFT_901233 [Fibularhizoctonia sp. CBS 109695]